MNKLETIISALVPGGEGHRLSGGLGLRLSRGNGMYVLGCSRYDNVPSETEMSTVETAVVSVFAPRFIFRSARPGWAGRGEKQHGLWRIYWPQEEIEMTYFKPMQLDLSARDGDRGS
jgi:hypothetical protein